MDERSTEPPEPRSQPLAAVALLGLAAVFVFVLFRTAWVSDDAYITFRTIDNWVNGYGLVFNVGERVQTFTHPLWMLLHVPFIAAGREVYTATLHLSIGLSIATLAILCFALAESRWAGALVLLSATFSKALVDYSTSGLENPLTHLLLAAFAWLLLAGSPSRQRLFYLALFAGLAATNRMDSALLFLPALALETWRSRGLPGVRPVLGLALGFLPFLAWELFALVYYGVPIPNTALAKLNTGTEVSTLVLRGVHYFRNSLHLDPVSLGATTAALVATLGSWVRSRRAMDAQARTGSSAGSGPGHDRRAALAVGALLYLLYILWIGGDFMSGRFFSAPFVVALILLARLPSPSNAILRGVILTLPIVFGLSSSHPLLRDPDDYSPRAPGIFDEAGIADERAYYFLDTGWIHRTKENPGPTHPWVEFGRSLRAGPAGLASHNNLGFVGYYAGPRIDLTDPYALADPLLSRLPAMHDPTERPGHYRRIRPRGYLEGRRVGENRIEDPTLAALYDRVRKVTRDPVWSAPRFVEILRLNFAPIEVDDYYRVPVVERLSQRDVATPRTAGTAWDAAGTHPMALYAGLRIDVEDGTEFQGIEVSLNQTGAYVIAVRRGEAILHSQMLEPVKPRNGLAVHRLELPSRVSDADHIAIYPMGALALDKRYSLGHLTLF